MSRVLVLIAAFLFFRAVLPRSSRQSPTAITPYRNNLDRMMSAQEMSSILDDFAPEESRIASHGANCCGTAREAKLPPDPKEVSEPAAFAVRSLRHRILRP